MKSANDAERLVLTRLKNYAGIGGQLTPAEAWKLLTSPKKKYEFKDKSAQGQPLISVEFSSNELKVLQSMKDRLVADLEKAAKKRCAYCKRPVGKYGWSWHIEHVKCKSKNRARTFERKNMVLACVDCNFHKNHSVDRKAAPFDIIDPSLPNFDYSEHLNYLQFGTEKIHLLRYRTISTPGINTYGKLKFSMLEYGETMKSINHDVQKLLERLDECIGQASNMDNGRDLSEFLLKLKDRILQA